MKTDGTGNTAHSSRCERVCHPPKYLLSGGGSPGVKEYLRACNSLVLP